MCDNSTINSQSVLITVTDPMPPNLKQKQDKEILRGDFRENSPKIGVHLQINVKKRMVSKSGHTTQASEFSSQ